MGNGIHEDLVRNFQGISVDLLGICTELIGNDWESNAERSERASGAIDVYTICERPRRWGRGGQINALPVPLLRQVFASFRCPGFGQGKSFRSFE